jgi:carbon storage regulator
MLVLTRKVNQTICIGSDIRITILGVTRGTVKIGLEAPNNVRILRGELLTQPGAQHTPKAVDAHCIALDTPAMTALSAHSPHFAR